MYPTYNLPVSSSHDNSSHQFEHEASYENNMEYNKGYNYCSMSEDEFEEMINQYIRDTDAEYRDRNRANIGKSVERFNRSLIEKYGAENVDPEDLLVISKEQYLIGEFDHCFKECQEKIEKKFMVKESCVLSECECPVILNETLREMLSHPNYSEVISSFLENVSGSYQMGESVPNTINGSDIVITEKHNQCSVAQRNESVISSPDRVEFHTISVDEECKFFSKDQGLSPLDEPTKLGFANFSSTDKEHVSISDSLHPSKRNDDSLLCLKDTSQLIDKTTVIISSWDSKSLPQMLFADDAKVRCKRLPGSEHIYIGLECSNSSNDENTQVPYYFDYSKIKPIVIYSTIQCFTPRLLSIQVTPHSLISISQPGLLFIPKKYVDMGSLTHTLEWIYLRWKHRRKVNENMLTINYSLVPKMRHFVLLPVCLLQERLSLKLKEGCSKMNKTSCNFFCGVSDLVEQLL